jgi:hypothetical protein
MRKFLCLGTRIHKYNVIFNNYLGMKGRIRGMIDPLF